MASFNWLKKETAAQQGSTLLVVLGMVVFCTTLGLVFLRAAHAREELAHERYVYRKTMNVLESMTRCACSAGAPAWKKILDEHHEDQHIGASTITIDTIAYSLTVNVEKGECVVRALCKGARGETVVLKTCLAWEGERVVFREQKRSTT